MTGVCAMRLTAALLVVSACGGAPTAPPATVITLPEPPPTTAARTPTTPFAGFYTLDREETKRAFIAALGKRTPDERAALRAAVNVFDKMDLDVELGAGGTVTMRSRASGSDEEKVEQGRWSRDGTDAVILSNGDGKDLRCVKRDTKLSCLYMAAERSQMTFVFSPAPR
jgi:hypothetical protein